MGDVFRNVSYPASFEKWDGVHIDKHRVNEYVQEVISTMRKQESEGEEGYCSIATGDVTVLGRIMEGDYHIEVYRNPDFCTIFREDM